ncbi:MAG: hypothetical protein AB1Z23_11125 [Eubacteriales bacterium]
MTAFRNIRLCTKDCLCLFVCPTGATDTENGQIDFANCLKDCRACVDACPSGALSLLPDEYPPPQKKADDVVSALFSAAKSKTEQEKSAAAIAAKTDDAALRQIASAIEMSNRVMAEDLIREAGYMLPQSSNVKYFLQSLLDNPPKGLPKDTVERLLDIL